MYILLNMVFYFLMFSFRNKFEFEYQQFMDGIAHAAFEYVCQLIIKNSLDNIKNTQDALKSHSLSINISRYYLINCHVMYLKGTIDLCIL